MPSRFLKDDPVAGYTDLDDEYVTDEWILDRYVGSALFAWGQGSAVDNLGNTYAGLQGTNDTVHRSSPVQVGRLVNWKQVAQNALSGACYGIRSDGTLWSWGYNRYGDFGIPSITYGTFRSSPIQVGTDTNWKQVIRNFDGGMALRNDGTLWWWGGHPALDLVSDTTSSPVQIATDGAGLPIRFRQLFSIPNSQVCFGLKHDGTLWSMGDNGIGQLGTLEPDFYTAYVPRRVLDPGQLGGWKQVTGSGNSVYAIKKDGSAWAWGAFSYPSFVNASSPVQIGSGTTWNQSWKFINGNALNLALIRYDGTLWMVGTPGNGQLGNNASPNITPISYSPKQVGSSTDWKEAYVVPTGQSTVWGVDTSQAVLAVKTDGTLWAWGGNGHGVLGTGDTVHRSSPVQVGSRNNWRSIVGGGLVFGLTYKD